MEKKMELIDREKLLKTIPSEEMVARMAVMSAPPVDAIPVRHGRWIYLDKDNKFFKKHIVKCSLCNNSLDLYAVNGGRGDANYCPNCGAKMGDGNGTD